MCEYIKGMSTKANYTVKRIRSAEIATFVQDLSDAGKNTFFKKHTELMLASLLFSIAAVLVAAASCLILFKIGSGVYTYLLIVPILLGITVASFREFLHRFMFLVQNRQFSPSASNNPFIRLLSKKR